jgi:hypothetical protein
MKKLLSHLTPERFLVCSELFLFACNGWLVQFFANRSFHNIIVRDYYVALFDVVMTIWALQTLLSIFTNLLPGGDNFAQPIPN